ncbi:MAG TPA: branched-chain amino acid ABC transporter permease [Myxococcales bacterium]
MKLPLPPWIRPRAAIGLLVACVLLSLVPLLHTEVYLHNLLTLTFIGISAALAWNWLGGYLGQVSFGHASMFGIGGFVAAQCQLGLKLPMLLSWAIGGIAAGVFSLVWGHPTLRLRGPYFSIATIGVGEATRLVCTYWDAFTGGSSGLSLPMQQNLKYDLYWYGVVLAGLAVAASYALRRSPMGLSLLAIKSDVDAASDVGVSATRLQDLVLFLSGLMIGICGSFYASYFSYIEPGDMFGFDRSISWVLMGVIGGIGTIGGPALGAVIFVIVQQYLLRYYSQLYLGLYGTLLVLIILFEPLGLTGLFNRIVRRARPDLAVTGVAGED